MIARLKVNKYIVQIMMKVCMPSPQLTLMCNLASCVSADHGLTEDHILPPLFFKHLSTMEMTKSKTVIIKIMPKIDIVNPPNQFSKTGYLNVPEVTRAVNKFAGFYRTALLKLSPIEAN